MPDDHILKLNLSKATHSGEKTLVFAGDFFLQRQPTRDISQILDQKLQKILHEADAFGANMEAPIQGYGKEIGKVGPALAMCPQAPELLRKLGASWVSLANNHAMDFGEKALDATMQSLEKNKIDHVGAGQKKNDAHRILIKKFNNGPELAIISACEYEFGIANDQHAGTAWIGSKRLIQNIQSAKAKGCFVIVCSHGGVEEVPLPSRERQKKLRALIDAGASLVVGHHPHVPQGWEFYQGKMICYSLGDFIFDRKNQNDKPWRNWGYLLKVTIDQDHHFNAEIVGYERVDDQIVCLGENRNAKQCFDYLLGLSEILQKDQLQKYWPCVVNDLVTQRYSPFLEHIFTPLCQPKTISDALKCLYQACRKSFNIRIGRRKKVDLDLSDLTLGRKLLFLNLIRCESHLEVLRESLCDRKPLDTQSQTKSLSLMEAMFTL